MKPEYIRGWLLFYFYQKKSAADVHRINCETYSENVIATLCYRTWAIWFKRFVIKMVFSISVTKNTLDALQLLEEDETVEKWKKMENTSINLYCIDFFFIVIKKLQKFGKNFCIDLIKYQALYNVCIRI